MSGLIKRSLRDNPKKVMDIPYWLCVCNSEDEPLGGVESDEEADVGVAACVERAAQAAPPPPPRLTDTRPAAASDSRLEYSYNAAVVAAWAGPAHWRLKNNKGITQLYEIK